MQRMLLASRRRYASATREEKTKLLDEFCKVTHYHRKYAIALLNQPAEEPQDQRPRRRGKTYSPAALRVVEAIWKAAGCPWSVRLKALLPLWLPWARTHLKRISPEIERQVLAISARQIDRRLASKKRRGKRRLYARTKPGTLLKHQIPVQAQSWDGTEPGYVEIDLVSHSGPSASGEFVYSLNVTDLCSGWCETRAILGRGEEGVVAGLEEIRCSLPFELQGIHSDNGSEFINHHLFSYCQEHDITFTRGRPYKKDDNAHIEQKNWTHVRQIFGWDRHDTADAAAAMNELYGDGLRVMMNWFQPSVKLVKRRRVGARVTRVYDHARTPLDRLVAWYEGQSRPPSLSALLKERDRTNPFELAETNERKLGQLSRH